jgi:hypothetical protein
MSRYLTVSHGISRYLTVSHGITLYLTVSYRWCALLGCPTSHVYAGSGMRVQLYGSGGEGWIYALTRSCSRRSCFTLAGLPEPCGVSQSQVYAGRPPRDIGGGAKYGSCSMCTDVPYHTQVCAGTALRPRRGGVIYPQTPPQNIGGDADTP